MTTVPLALTDPARELLDGYLSRVRNSLRGCKSVDPAEVERDIREHIEAELKDAAEPIAPERLSAVLTRLGSPDRWTPIEDLPLWRRLLLKIRTSQADHRIVYISFGLFVLAPVLIILLQDPVAFSLAVILLFVSFCLARTALPAQEEIPDPDMPRWLLYPQLLVGYLFILLLVAAWPAAAVAGVFDFLDSDPQFRSRVLRLPDRPLIYMGNSYNSPMDLEIYSRNHVMEQRAFLTATAFGTAAVGLWLIVVGLFLAAFKSVTRAVFRPFADSRPRLLALVIAGIGLLGFIVGGIAAGCACAAWYSNSPHVMIR